ncbi:hypothetical protein SAMN05445756_2078 [Kytococcus aerolatus]|uniref:Uncharacterized protein n=2 Tax=Kytococcus aerolatus TaxID=592308 RepID=A0A212U604_9MICO|nr:hypothetical protein SAMN05445756_2078 [Kytococcus aerolatus]
MERGGRAAGLAAALSALLLLTGQLLGGTVGGVLVASLLGAVVAGGWGRVLDLPSHRGVTGVLGLVVLLGGVAAWAAHRGEAPEVGSVWWALPLAGGVLGALAHQVWRRDGRPRVVDVLSAEIFATLVLGAGLLWSWATPLVAVTTAAGLAVTAVGDALFVHRRAESWAVGSLVGAATALGWSVGRHELDVPDTLLLAALAVLAPAVSQACRLVLLRLPAVRSGARGGLVTGLVSTLLAGIVAGLFTLLGSTPLT